MTRSARKKKRKKVAAPALGLAPEAEPQPATATGHCEIICDESGYYLVIDGYEIQLFEDTRPGNPTLIYII